MGTDRSADAGLVTMLVMIGLVVCTTWALVGGAEAARRNRRVWVWTLLGTVFAFVPLIPLLWMRRLCPTCRKGLSPSNWTSRSCPTCGDISALTKPNRPFRRPRVDVYTMLLILALLGILGAIVCLYLELDMYDWRYKAASSRHADRPTAVAMADEQWLVDSG